MSKLWSGVDHWTRWGLDKLIAISQKIFSNDFNTLSPRQNGRHFPDDIFKSIFLIENVCISVKISSKFVPKGQINNMSALVQVMAWRHATSHYLNQWWLVYWRMCLSLNELMKFHLSSLPQFRLFISQHWSRTVPDAMVVLFAYAYMRYYFFITLTS